MDFRKKFLVKPGTKFKLSDIDPDFHGDMSEEDGKQELEQAKAKLTEMQRLFYGDRSRALLIVLQGIDGAGKDGTCWHVISAMDPQGVKVQGFKQPTPEEQAHDFLWRVHPHAPAKGEVAVFNRSHYEDVLVVRVHKLVPKPVWQARYDFINQWEKLLHDDNNTTILKFFLYISKEEQLARFKERLDDPGTAVEDQRVRLQGARLLGRLHRRLRGCADQLLEEARAVVRDSVEPQMVPQSRGVADHRRHDGGHEAEAAEADRRPRRNPAALPRAEQAGKGKARTKK